MFIKFNECLIDVANCVFKRDIFKGRSFEEDVDTETPRILLLPTESDFGQSQHILVETFETLELRDQRYAELSAMLQGSLDKDFCLGIIKDYKNLLVQEKKFEEAAKVREAEKILETI